jgi:hypothetical protein
MKNYYKTDFSLLARLLLPTFLRGKILVAMIAAAMKHPANIHGSFTDYADSLTVRANNQACYMQAMLNDEFDRYERRIRVRVAPVNVTDSLLLWREDMNRPSIILYREDAPGAVPFLLSRDGELYPNNSDIEIVFPPFFYLSKDEKRRLNTLINSHKLASKKYRIIYEQD